MASTHSSVAPPPAPRRLPHVAAPGTSLFFLAASLVLVFLVIPIVALLWRATTFSDLSVWTRPFVLDALRLSLFTTAITALVSLVLGTPVAYLLARYDFPGRAAVDTLVDLPMVLPPAVAGIALLMAFGRRGLLGPALGVVGISLPFTAAAVVIAQTFVAAPFYIRAARAGFLQVDRRLEQISATLGLTPWKTFWRVTLPLAAPSLIGGAIMTVARALGEFGATILFAGNFQGRTQTMPLAIYVGLETDLDAAVALACILMVVSFSLLLLVRVLTGHNLPNA